MSSLRKSIGPLGLLIAALQLPPPASASDEEVIESLTRSAASLAVEGDPAGIGMLRLLLGLDENYQHVFSDLIEETQLAETLPNALQSFDAADQARARKLLEQLAEAEGAATRSAAYTVLADAKSITLDFTEEKTKWLVMPHSGPRAGELLLHTQDCTPDLTVFAPNARLPASVRHGAVRYTASLLGLPVVEGAAVRIRPGSCDADQLTLDLAWHQGRKTLPSSANSNPTVVADQVTVVSLTSPSRSFAVQTEPGYVYSVYAAPVDSKVDPILARISPENELAIIDSDDDSGWGTAAKLEPFAGTGRLEKFTVSRNDATAGNVAILVSQHKIPRRAFEGADPVDVTPESAGWQIMSIPAGEWVISTSDLSPNFDPILSVFDAKTGKLLAHNDAADEHTVVSRVHLRIHEPTELLMRVESADQGGGSTRLEVRHDTDSVRPAKNLKRARTIQTYPLSRLHS